MKLSLTRYGKTISVETEHDDYRFDDFMDEVVKPVVAAFYSTDLWNRYFEEME